MLWFRFHFASSLLNYFVINRNRKSWTLEVFPCFPAFDVVVFPFHNQIMRLSPSLRKTLNRIQCDVEKIRDGIAGLIAPRPDIEELVSAIRNSNETNQLQRKYDQDKQLVSLRSKEQIREAGERYTRKY